MYSLPIYQCPYLWLLLLSCAFYGTCLYSKYIIILTYDILSIFFFFMLNKFIRRKKQTQHTSCVKKRKKKKKNWGMCKDSLKFNNPCTEKETSGEIHSYKVFKEKYFCFIALISWPSQKVSVSSTKWKSETTNESLRELSMENRSYNFLTQLYWSFYLNPPWKSQTRVGWAGLLGKYPYCCERNQLENHLSTLRTLQ